MLIIIIIFILKFHDCELSQNNGFDAKQKCLCLGKVRPGLPSQSLKSVYVLGCNTNN